MQPSGNPGDIAVTPEKGALAVGTVKTDISGDIMEARLSNRSTTHWNKTAVTNSWRDRGTVSGEIRKVQKMMSYESGMKV
ncbi:MAG: hypothetical protein LUQ07_07870 [Methanospirillum sp.]|nr:hypothetical protein [Methanospirillum sp.]